MRYDEKQTEHVGKHDFVPATGTMYENIKTTSVGIFKWVMKSNGKSMKKSKAVVRVIGDAKQLERINLEAKAIVDLLDNGDWHGVKTVKV